MSSNKIIHKEEVKKTFSYHKKASKSLVFTNGCFDILHPGHISYLEEAKKMGHILIVGVNSDASISRLKGKSRPIHDFFFRSLMLSALESVDYVIEFEEDTPISLIEKVIPNVLVKGNDYDPNEIVGADFVKSQGGSVNTITFLPGFSTSQIVEKIQRLP